MSTLPDHQVMIEASRTPAESGADLNQDRTTDGATPAPNAAQNKDLLEDEMNKDSIFLYMMSGLLAKRDPELSAELRMRSYNALLNDAEQDRSAEASRTPAESGADRTTDGAKPAFNEAHYNDLVDAKLDKDPAMLLAIAKLLRKDHRDLSSALLTRASRVTNNNDLLSLGAIWDRSAEAPRTPAESGVDRETDGATPALDATQNGDAEASRTGEGRGSWVERESSNNSTSRSR